MNATYTVTFKGFSEKFDEVLAKMLYADIGAYPSRLRMESASVETVPEPAPAKKKAKKKAKRNAKS